MGGKKSNARILGTVMNLGRDGLRFSKLHWNPTIEHTYMK